MIVKINEEKLELAKQNLEIVDHYLCELSKNLHAFIRIHDYRYFNAEQIEAIAKYNMHLDQLMVFRKALSAYRRNTLKTMKYLTKIEYDEPLQKTSEKEYSIEPMIIKKNATGYYYFNSFKLFDILENKLKIDLENYNIGVEYSAKVIYDKLQERTLEVSHYLYSLIYSSSALENVVKVYFHELTSEEKQYFEDLTDVCNRILEYLQTTYKGEPRLLSENQDVKLFKKMLDNISMIEIEEF